MTELVIVAADLYWEHLSSAGAPVAPALEQLARFAQRSPLAHGWRAWLAGRLGGGELAAAAPATIAAAALPPLQGAQAWLATPLHLSASLTSVHLTPGGVLHLNAPTQARLAADFALERGELGHRLTPLSGGGFLAHGPRIEGITHTTDPARGLGASIAGAQPRGPGAAQLQRLSAEIETWLHAHALNAERARSGERPVSSLWLWGGGELALEAGFAPEMPPPPHTLFGDDPYVVGLASLSGARWRAQPPTLAGVAAGATGSVTAVVVELYREREPALSTPAEALEALDREFLVPALAALARGELSAVTLIANDRSLRLRHRDRLRLWRRRCTVLEALT